MFKEVIPTYTFGNLRDLYEALKQHKIFNEYSDACDVSVDTNGVIQFGVYPAPMSNIFAPQLMKTVGLPKKNLDVLSPERIAGDVNYRLQHMPENTVLGLRIFDTKAYDIYEVKKEKYLLPVHHAKFIDMMLLNLPELQQEYEFTFAAFDFADGLRLRAFNNNVAFTGPVGSEFTLGVEFRNRDYNRNVYGSSVSYILHDTVNNVTVSGIQKKNHKVRKESSEYLDQLFEDAAILMNSDTKWLRKAFTSLAETKLTPHTVDITYKALVKAVGKKDANVVMYDYIQDDLYDWKKKVPKPEQNPEHSEYTLFDVIAKSAPMFAVDPFAAQEAAGVILDSQICAVKQNFFMDALGGA